MVINANKFIIVQVRLKSNITNSKAGGLLTAYKIPRSKYVGKSLVRLLYIILTVQKH